MAENSLHPNSHRAAADLFDRTADTYQQKADAQVYSTTTFIFARRKEIVLQFLDESGARESVLDFGMGPGVFAPAVAERGLHFIGIDLSPVMVERAQALGLDRTTFVVGDLETLEEYRGRVDVVMAIGLIDYLEDPQDGLRRLAACVRPGGTILVSFRNRMAVTTGIRNAAKAIWRGLFGRMGWRQDTAFATAVHEKSFSFRSQLRPWLTQEGFGGFRVQYFDLSPFFFNVPVPRPIWKAWFAWDRIVARSFTRGLCSAGVVSARKLP